MKLKPDQRVPLDVAETRALAALNRKRTLNSASVADAIWPDHQMKAQGAGAAASRILKRLEKAGKVRWHSDENGWGWMLTQTNAHPPHLSLTTASASASVRPQVTARR